MTNDDVDPRERAESAEPTVMRQIYRGEFDHLFMEPLRDMRVGVNEADLARFDRFVAIDWSGARGEFQRGIAVAECEAGNAAPRIVTPPASVWSRQAIIEMLRQYAADALPVLIGFDFSPSLPFADRGAYFPGWAETPPDMRRLWSLVDQICEQDRHLGVDRFVGHEQAREHFRAAGALGSAFQPGRGRLRRCEQRQIEAGLSPSSTFNLIGAAQVGKSSLTGMRVLNRLHGRVPLWPLDPIPLSGPYLIEIYTTVAAREAGIRAGRSKVRTRPALEEALQRLGVDQPVGPTSLDDHVTDALITAAWLRRAATRIDLWHPAALTPEIARTEGWTFGVV